MTCRFKSESINDHIGPHNVFILKKDNDFAYAVIDNADGIYRLPKKYFTTCFPGVQYSSIPENNRIKIKLTRNNTIEVPYIPKSFLLQKRRKTTRSKRRRTLSMDNHEDSRIEQIDFSVEHPQWHILTNDQNRSFPVKKEILNLIRSLLMYADSNECFTLENPFKDIKSLEEVQSDENKMKILKVVTSFIYHFCRSEMGISKQPTPSDLQAWIGYLNNMATV